MEQKNKKIPATEENLYRINESIELLVAEQQRIGTSLVQIADRLEKINWNLGTISKNTEK